MAVLRSNVMSRKSRTFLLASIVICKLLCLMILQISFLTASTCLGVFVQVANLPSLYNQTLMSRWVNWDNRNSSTSSKVSDRLYCHCAIIMANLCQNAIDIPLQT